MNLLPDNTCAIYPVRPDICRVHGRFQENATECNRMQVQDGIPESFRVTV